MNNRYNEFSHRQLGFTYVELMLALLMLSLLMVGLMGIVNTAGNTGAEVTSRNDIARDARFAMQRMSHAVSNTRLLLLPLSDNPATTWPENIREQTVPASLPIGDSTLATAVLAVTLPIDSDLDSDGYADADDDRDGRIDEDLASDGSFDGVSGIYLIDDDGDGQVDEDASGDDDESGTIDEDVADNLDNDGDSSVDEDLANDMNGDICPGVCGVDDDSDGIIHEGTNADDDEDGSEDEDWHNPVVFYLENQSLMQRTAVPWDTDGSNNITGRDFVVSSIAENVTHLRFERLVSVNSEQQLVDITLEITHPISGEQIHLQTQVRIGGAF